MQAEPQVSMRGGGVIGDWYVARHSQLSYIESAASSLLLPQPVMQRSCDSSPQLPRISAPAEHR